MKIVTDEQALSRMKKWPETAKCMGLGVFIMSMKSGLDEVAEALNKKDVRAAKQLMRETVRGLDFVSAVDGTGIRKSATQLKKVLHGAMNLKAKGPTGIDVMRQELSRAGNHLEAIMAKGARRCRFRFSDLPT